MVGTSNQSVPEMATEHRTQKIASQVRTMEF
jgi:hypothetical protein